MISCVLTDTGTTKEINQDSIFCKNLLLNGKQAVFGCVCDGLGGLSGGEIASSNAVHSLIEWFQSKYPYVFLDLDSTKESLLSCIEHYNGKLFRYSRKHHTHMGTTISGVILFHSNYLTVNAGDSRTYLLRDNQLIQLTKDHSYIQQEIDAGRMTVEEAKESNQQNVLTSCVGAYETSITDMTTGLYKENDVFIFCSDGARHFISKEEFIELFSGISSKDGLKTQLSRVIDLCKERGETDNISIGAIIVKE